MALAKLTVREVQAQSSIVIDIRSRFAVISAITWWSCDPRAIGLHVRTEGRKGESGRGLILLTGVLQVGFITAAVSLFQHSNAFQEADAD